MPPHHLAAWAMLIAIPLGLAILLFFALIKRISVAAATSGAVTTFFASFLLLLTPIDTCTNSYDTLLAARRLLTPAEYESLEGMGLVCPTLYSFKRESRFVCFSTDGDGGGHIGCE